MMKRFIFLLIFMLACISYLNIVHENTLVKASSGEVIYLDTDFIHEIAENLSYMIYTSYPEDDIPKGRAFGTKGEWDAAEYLAVKMAEVDLEDELGLDPSYLDLIENPQGILSDAWVAYCLRDTDTTLTDKYEILDRVLMLNHSGNKTLIDGHVSSISNENIENVNLSDLKIIKTEDYTCTDDYLKNII